MPPPRNDVERSAHAQKRQDPIHRGGIRVEAAIVRGALCRDLLEVCDVVRIAETREQARYLEELARKGRDHHVDLVALGHRDGDVGALDPGLAEDAPSGAVALHHLHVERAGKAARVIGIALDDHHVVAVRGEPRGERRAGQPSPDDQDLHRGSPLRRGGQGATSGMAKV
jgi:hypothetical protein